MNFCARKRRTEATLKNLSELGVVVNFSLQYVPGVPNAVIIRCTFLYVAVHGLRSLAVSEGSTISAQQAGTTPPVAYCPSHTAVGERMPSAVSAAVKGSVSRGTPRLLCVQKFAFGTCSLRSSHKLVVVLLWLTVFGYARFRVS